MTNIRQEATRIQQIVPLFLMVEPGGIEPTTYGLEGKA